MKNSKEASLPKNTRKAPVIGYFALRIGDNVGQSLWSGVTDAAVQRGAKLVSFAGGRLQDPSGSSSPANIVYELAMTKFLDGLVSWASAVGGNLSGEETVAFHQRFSPLPMVSIALPMNNIPTVLIENYFGVKDLVAHFVKVHGFSRIAFIRGPENHFYAEERFRAYRDSLKELKIPLDDKLVTPAGDFDPSTGIKAISLFLDKRKLRPGIDIQAIMTASDIFALSSMAELEFRGIHVPWDLAVAGFNDAVEGRFASTPLTTVRPPFYETGFTAVETLLDMIEGKDVPREIVLPGKMIVRKSCGCPSLAIQQITTNTIAEKTNAGAVDSLHGFVAENKHQIVSELLETLDGKVPKRISLEKLFDGFVSDMEKTTRNAFLSALEIVLDEFISGTGVIENRSIVSSQNIISYLRSRISPLLDIPQRLQSEELWHQARIIIGETAEHAQARLVLQAKHQAQILRDVGHVLLTTFDLNRLMDAFEQGLPHLEIPSVYLALYENPKEPLEWSRLMLAYNEFGRVELGGDGIRFPSKQLLPDAMLPDRLYSFVVEPLYFQTQQLGFILCEVGPVKGEIYEMLRMQISNVLQGYFLVQRVEERSAALSRQQYILDTFMKNIPDRIYFKDLDSKITRANEAFVRQFGMHDPVEVVGKSDFDFFSKDQAQIRFDQEQEIIQTGDPLVNVEEIDSNGNWAVTTKMPLRDEHGNIIGTFGISHDISDIKEAQAELVRQERLSALGQLTATVAHEIRNPLSTVRTSVFSIGLAIERNELDRIKRTLELAERNIIRCDNIITELLDYTRDRVLTLKSHAIDNWLVKILDEYTFPETIECVRQLDAGVHVSIDSESFRRAVINTLTNAVEAIRDESSFSPGDGSSARQKTGGRVTIRSCITAERVEIHVQDTGPGIPPEVLAELFKPLFSTKNFGVGLGLTIIKGIMEQHEGGIEMLSTVGEGTEVILWLPLAVK